MAEGVIDLDSELQGLFGNEAMLGFFDFRVGLGESVTAQGLCKVSELKKHDSGSTYFSLLFIIDVPPESSWTAIDALMSKVRWSRLGEHLAHLENVVSVPVPRRTEHIYMTETYVYVAPPSIPENQYLASILFPAVTGVTGFHAGELVVWDGSVADKDKGGTSSPALEKLRRLLQS